MNLAIHQFCKDVRQFRVLLAIWYGLLLLDLAANLGWAGRVTYTPWHGFDHAANIWTGLLPIVLWAFVVILPSLVVLTDSPARREGFLATRPLPKFDLCLAKVIFVIALIVAPWVLQETVHLKCEQMPAWVVERGSFERLMFTLPVVLGCAAYAALWPNTARWARSVAIIVVASYLLLAIVAMISVYLFHSDDFSTGSGVASEIVGGYVLMIAIVVLMVWHSRAHRGAVARWSGLVMVVIIHFVTTSRWHRDFFQLEPQNQVAANSLMASAGLEIPFRSLQLQKIQTTDDNDEQPHFSINFDLKTHAPLTNYLIEWAGKEGRLSRYSGGTIHVGKAYAPGLFDYNDYWQYSFRIADFKAWSTEFPRDIVFLRGPDQWSQSPNDTITFNRFEFPTNHSTMTEPLTLHADFQARVFHWSKIADIPLTPGATTNDEFGSWKYIAAMQQPGLTSLFLERCQIELATVSDSRCSSSHEGAITRMACMLYDPKIHVVWLANQAPSRNATRGGHTALPKYYLQLMLPTPKQFTPKELERCRLIVFEKSWDGSVPEKWVSPSFTVEEKFRSNYLGTAGNEEPMPHDEFERRVAALKTPSPDATRPEVSRYLLEYLRLVDAQRYILDLQDPHNRQLLAVVPTHLDLLLDGLPVMEDTSKSSVIEAIKLGASEAQKPAIIAAVQQEPELAKVLLARGWVEDARKEICQLAQSGSPSRPLPISAVRAIALLQDPQTYPRLLEEFDANPTVVADNVLRTLPGLDESLETIVARHWRDDSIVMHQRGWQMFGGSFELALRYGYASALQRAYLLLDDEEFAQLNELWPIANALDGAIQMPDINFQHNLRAPAILAWMRKHRPGDFVYNPALRQFVLNANLSTHETATNP